MPSCYGASPNKPILFRIPVTGQRPITYSIPDLPEGLSLSDGIVSGKIACEGDYKLTLIAENPLGRDEMTLTLEIHPDRLQLTPLMGFTTWNAFGYGVTQAQVEGAAEKLADSGKTRSSIRNKENDDDYSCDAGKNILIIVVSS